MRKAGRLSFYRVLAQYFLYCAAGGYVQIPLPLRLAIAPIGDFFVGAWARLKSESLRLIADHFQRYRGKILLKSFCAVLHDFGGLS